MVEVTGGLLGRGFVCGEGGGEPRLRGDGVSVRDGLGLGCWGDDGAGVVLAGVVALLVLGVGTF